METAIAEPQVETGNPEGVDPGQNGSQPQSGENGSGIEELKSKF